MSVPLDLKVTLKDTRLKLNIIYVWKLNQTVLELDFRAIYDNFCITKSLSDVGYSSNVPDEGYSRNVTWWRLFQ